MIDVADDGGSANVQDIAPARVSPTSGSDRGDSLVRSLADWKRVVDLLGPEAISVLLPESHERTKQVHSYWSPRCEVETLVGLAAGSAGIPIDYVARATVRAQLKIEGKLDDAAKATTKHGKYWNQRSLALLAAKATAQIAADNGWSHIGEDSGGGN